MASSQSNDLILTSTITMDATILEFENSSADLVFNFTGEGGGRKSGIVSDEVLQYIFTINYSIVCAAICVFGIVANIINICVFVKMKFRETINIAFLGLAISDLASLVSLLWTCICFNPLLMYSDAPFISFEIQQKTGSWTHFVFIRVTAFITAYITLERCLCIVYPLKVKQILTHRRVVAIVVGIYLVIIACMSPNYSTARLAWKFIPSRNRSLVGFVYIDGYVTIHTVSYYINVVLLLASFTAVTVCSAVLIWKLGQRAKWLTKATSAVEKSQMTRDGQVIKMVAYVAIIFVVLFTPSVVNFFAIALVPEFNLGRRYQNLFFVLGTIFFICDAVNSSVNIFIFYKMSSRYALVLRSMFSCKEKTKK